MSTPNLAPLNRRTVLRGSITLAGALVVLPGMASLGGCTVTPPSFEPLRPLVSAIADAIIPATDTPGALNAGVPDYVVAVFDQHLSPEQQREFADGLDALDALSRDALGFPFAEASAAERAGFLAAVTELEEGTPAKVAWRQLRDIVIFGFFTSEAATEVLPYEELPGRYAGCLPLDEVGGAWLERGV